VLSFLNCGRAPEKHWPTYQGRVLLLWVARIILTSVYNCGLNEDCQVF
jgi:hypothetical protein